MMTDNQQVRVRFAPSPTGALHIGGARTAYFNWLFARQQHGAFVLRIDDTDTARSTEESYQQILDSFRWLGIDWDEGPDVGGSYGPYRQSERGGIYQVAMERLIAEDKVYPCFCSVDELAQERERMQKEGRAPRYSGKCQSFTKEQRDTYLTDGKPHVYRLRVPATGETVVSDVIRGDVVFANQEIDDFIVWKADGTPTYHFASCVDDHVMNISHVIRAEEHLSNTPRHVVLFHALGANVPIFAHVPMILAPDRSKLSKRHGATSVQEYRDMGILAEALVNYLLLLGFAPGDNREILSREEAIAAFQLGNVAKHAAVYDVKKLEWLNGHYLRAQNVDHLLDLLWPELQRRGWVQVDTPREKLAWVRTMVDRVRERSRNLHDLISNLIYFFEPVTMYDEKGVNKHFQASVTVAERLRAAANLLEQTDPFIEPVLDRVYRQLIEELNIKGGELIHPSRLALSGLTVGPGLFDIMALLGKQETCARLRQVADKLCAGEFA